MLVKRTPWMGRRVLLTGHTGFKGGWLALWLKELGAEVTGFAFPPATDPSFFDQVRLAQCVRNVEGDVRNLDEVRSVFRETQPEVVFHLAAQALVRHSYRNPVETYATNVMGTVHVLEACREVPSVRAIVCVTSDKCYENREWVWPYRESDPMGGHDPYSSSKGAAELVISAYRRSFFEEGPLLASARAGNVIGGGDWSADRLVPDIVRAMLSGEAPVIRSPNSVRPWQHVLEALRGYLMLAEFLLQGDHRAAAGWNFGPADDDTRPVSWVVDAMLSAWGGSEWKRPSTSEQPHEAITLKLDCSKARTELGWIPALRLKQALDRVVEWHAAVHRGADARQISLDQLRAYLNLSSRDRAGEHAHAIAS